MPLSVIRAAFAVALALAPATAFAQATGGGSNGGGASITCSGGQVVTSTTPPGACGSPASSGIVGSGTANGIPYYASTGTTVSGLSPANNSVLVTGSGGLPALATTLPSGLTLPSETLTSPTINGTVGGNAFGTAATANTGTSGSVLGFLNGNWTQSGNINLTGTFSIGGNAMTFPGSAKTLAATDWSNLFAPSATDLMLSGGTNTEPTGLAPVNGDCVIGSGGAWVAGNCGGTPLIPANVPFAPANNIMQYACGVTIADGGNHELSATSQCGLNTVTTLSGLAAVTVPGATPSTPFGFATNATYGLTFSMNTSANQGSPGTTLTFVCAGLSGVGYSGLSVPCFNGYPGAQNQVVQPGMVVTGSCIAAATTVSSILVTAGTVTLNQNTSSACSSGTSITFSLSSTQIGELSVAYLAVEAGLYNAGQAGGGAAYVPRGTYVIAPSGTVCCQLIRPEGTGASAVDTADLIGEQQGTILKWNADLGWARAIPNTTGLGEPCAITLPLRRSGDGYDWTRNITFDGPGSSNANQSGTVVAYMDGLCIGSKSNVDNVFGQWFDAGLNIEDDHQTIRNSGFNNNFYGIYFGPNQEIIGNQYFDRVAGVGNAWAAVAFAWNNAFNAGIMQQTDLSQTPWAMYSEKVPTTAGSGCSGTVPCGGSGAALTAPVVLSGDVLTNALAEDVTCGYFYSDGDIAGWNGNTFISSQTMISYGGSCPVSGYSTRLGVVYLAYMAANTFINTDWTDAGAAFSDVTEGIFVATNNFLNNRFSEFGLTISNIASQTVPFIYGTGGAPNAASNTWCSGGGTGGGSPAVMQACGVFAGSTGTFVAGDLLALNSSDQVLRMPTPTTIPYGVAMQGGSIGYPGLVPVARSGGAVLTNVATTPTVGAGACSDGATNYKVGICSGTAAFGTYLGSDYIDLIPSPVIPTLQHYDLGFTAGITPTHSLSVHVLQSMTVTAIYGWVDAAATATANVDVYEVPSGTACGSSGTKMNTTAFNAEGSANTEQSLGVNTSTVTVGDTLCLVAENGGQWTTASGTLTLQGHP